MRRCLIALLLTLCPTLLPAQSLPDTPSARAFAELDIQTRMLDVPLTGDADIDFVRHMIPQHQRSIEMAELVLEHGHNPEVRAMAEALIETRRPQLDAMLVWLARFE